MTTTTDDFELDFDLEDGLHEECGVVGVFGHPEAAKYVYLGLYALQHRGQEAAGIVSAHNGKLYQHRDVGLVREVFDDKRLGGPLLDKLPGSAAIGHTRYSTAGHDPKLNVQPLYVETSKGPLAISHNGNLTNAAEIRRDLEREGSIFQATTDTEAFLHLMARSRENAPRHALRDALLHPVEGAFSIALLTRDRLIVARDRHGFRPLSIGKMKTAEGEVAWVFASETCVFDLIGATHEGDVQPGEMITVSDSGAERESFASPASSAACVFEHVYFARPDSTVFGRPVEKSRFQMGRILAEESLPAADCVVPVPDGGTISAMGFAEASGLPYTRALIRNHYVGRTFIEPNNRDIKVRQKLNPIRHLIEGRRVVLIDDSIVRGTTSRAIVQLVREAGAKEVHLRIACPPTIAACYYGVDTPDPAKLMANTHSVEEIRAHSGADSLAYLSMDGLRRAVEDEGGKRHCYSCYTGRYPTRIVGVDQLIADHNQKDRPSRSPQAE